MSNEIVIRTGLSITSGTSSNFLKGDGSVDSSTYTKSAVVVSYTQLSSLIGSSALVPGQTYLINDFKSIYDQPDYDSSAVAKSTVVTKTSGTTEPIIVTSLTSNTLSSSATSTLYPTDKLSYNFSFTTTEIMGATAKGRITERIDSNGNRTGYDHRFILFKRYETTNGSGIYDNFRDTGFGHTESSTFGTSCFDNYIGDNLDSGFLLINSIFGNNCHSNAFGNTFLNNTFNATISNVSGGNSVKCLVFGSNNTNWQISDNINFMDKVVPLVSSELQPYTKIITKSDTNIIFKYVDGFGDTVVVDIWNNSGSSPIPFGPVVSQIYDPTNKTVLSTIDQTSTNNWGSAYTNMPSGTERTNWNGAYTHISDSIVHITTGERSLWNAGGYVRVDSVTTTGLVTLARNTVTNLSTTLDNTSTIEIQLGTPLSGYTNEYFLFFQTGLTAPTFTFTAPGGSSFYWISGISLTPLANKVYVVSIFQRSTSMYIINYQ